MSGPGLRERLERLARALELAHETVQTALRFVGRSPVPPPGPGLPVLNLDVLADPQRRDEWLADLRADVAAILAEIEAMAAEVGHEC